MVTITNIEKLKKFLPHGAQYRVAKKLNVSSATVGTVLKGKITTAKALLILNELSEEAIRHRKHIAENVNSISQAVGEDI